MPDIRFTVSWPDGAPEVCYSPSTILRQHLTPGAYPMTEFMAKVRAGLTAASRRVEQTHGFPCSMAAGQLRALEDRAARYADDATVTVVTVG